MAETFWHCLTRGVRRLHERADWRAFAGDDWPGRIMAVPVTDRFHAKQGRTTGRWVVEAEDRRLAVYLKRHYQLPRWHGLLATFWPGCGWSPALQEWHHLGRARALGLPVPERVAVAEYVGPWGRLQSFLAVEELAGMLPLHEAIPAAAHALAPAPFAAWKRGLVHELARLARTLHGAGYFHRDLYLCHFYVPQQGLAWPLPPTMAEWRGQVHLIDLHRLARHSWTAWRWQAKDLAQLLYSSEIEGVGARDRLRFWKYYLGRRRRALRGRCLRLLILFKGRSYRRHNAKRKGSGVRGQGCAPGVEY
jgi:heptose I phosphotransferase